MNLYRVTLTGADDSVSPSILFDIAKQYPFVEFGLLLSESRLGAARVPSLNWWNWLCDAAELRKEKINISIHLCGKWMRQVLCGDASVLHQQKDIFRLAQRIQLNCSKCDLRSDRTQLLDLLRQNSRLCHSTDWQWIIQLGDDTSLLTWAIENGVNAVGLFDKSGGTGIVPSAWPQPTFKAESYGYAGGLGPENIDEQLQNIWTALFVSDGGATFWCDAESKLRDSQDGFSIPKCLQFLDKCKPYVKGN